MLRLRLLVPRSPAPSMRPPVLAFHAAQSLDAVIEHVQFRRKTSGLAQALAAYADHHRRRAARTSWKLRGLHSVVVPCYGHAGFLATALDTVLAQNHRP